MVRLLRAVAVLAVLLVAATTTGGTALAAGKQDIGIQFLNGRIVYYNGSNGSGAIGMFDSTDQHVTLNNLPAGASLKGWTHAVANADGRILWYKRTPVRPGSGR